MRSLISRRRDEALAVAVTLVYAAEVLARAGASWSLLGLAPLLAVAVRVRRRLPVLALVAVVGCWTLTDLVDPSFNEDGGLAWLVTWLVAHYSLGRWTAGMTAVVAPLLSVSAAVALGWSDIADSGVADLAYFASVSLLPWGAGFGVRVRQARVDDLDEQNRRLEVEQVEGARRAVAAERARIARELHDVVSHAIAVTVLQARGARRKLGHDDDAVVEALDAIESTNAAALGDMRRLLAVLRDTETVDDPRAPQPSLAMVAGLLEEVRRAGLPVELEVAGDLARVPPGIDLSAYRILQEALTNVLRHAGEGARAWVRLESSPQELTVQVHNSAGAGGVVGEGAGHGLVGIGERVAVVGGELSARPDADGFTLRARLPYALEVS